MRVFTHAEAKKFVEVMSQAIDQRRPPPVLFLGAGASVASSQPTGGEFAEIMSETHGEPVGDFWQLCQNFSYLDVLATWNRSVVQGAPSYGYRYLARLTQQVRFPLILTTNWDSHLEDELRRVGGPMNVQVHVRPFTADDDIAKAIRTTGGDIHVVKLHGDLQTEIQFDPKQLMKLEEKLSSAIGEMIRDHGIVTLGYGLHEPRVISLLDNASYVCAVDPFENTSILHIGSKFLYHVDGDEAEFDTFCECLVNGIYHRGLQDRISAPGRPGKKKAEFRKNKQRAQRWNQIITDLEEDLTIHNLTESNVTGYTDRLFDRINEHFGDKNSRANTALIFVDDAISPGGQEMRRLAERSGHIEKVKEYQKYNLVLAASNARDREVQKIEPRLKKCNGVVLIDNIAFSGNTLGMIKDHLEREHNLNVNVAGLMMINPGVRAELEAKGWTVLAAAEHNGSQLECPWGVTRPTSRFQGEAIEFRDNWCPLETRDFIVDRSLEIIPKPWGELRQFPDRQDMTVRLIYLDRDQRTSLHYHLLRNESFFVLDDRIRLQLWDRYLVLRKHQAIRIPAGVPHALIGLEYPCRVLEVGSGLYDQQRDIVRLEDPYARPNQGGNCNGYD